MPRTNDWSKIPFYLTIELGFSDDGEIWDKRRERILKPLNGVDVAFQDGDWLVIEFTSSGSYDPGVISGPIEKSYPPEGSDERLLEKAYVLLYSGDPPVTIELTKEVQQQLFNLYVEEVNEYGTN